MASMKFYIPTDNPKHVTTIFLLRNGMQFPMKTLRMEVTGNDISFEVDLDELRIRLKQVGAI